MIRTIKFVVSVIFWTGLRIWHELLRLAGRRMPGTCIVLYYHAVSAEDRSRFARQMDILKKSAKPIAADAKGPLESGVHYAVVTFDDGFQSTAENAIPELVQRGIPSTIFVPSGYLGKHPRWTEEPHYRDREEIVMTAEQLRQISSELTSVESHTVTHPKLPLLKEEDAKRELIESKSRLEDLLGRKIKLLSFPYGNYNRAVVDWSREAGYERTFSILPRPAFSEPHEFVTGRVTTNPRDWPVEFRLKLAGGYSWLPLAFALKRYMRLSQ